MFFPVQARSTSSRGKTLALLALVAVAVWISDQVGWLDGFDGALYDRVARLQASLEQFPARTVLCYVEPDTAESPRQLSELIARIAAGRPQGVMLTFRGPLSSTAARAAIEDETLTLAPANLTDASTACEATTPTSADAGPWICTNVEQAASPLLLSSLATEAPGTGSSPCVAYLPRTSDGTHRWHPRGIRVGDRVLPTLETHAAQLAGVDVGFLASRFRIQFRGAAGSLPYVASTDVDAGKTLPELFDGKIVLLGRQETGPYAGLTTPTTQGGFLMSPLEYHGHVLNTLLNRRAVSDLPPLFQLAFLLALSAALPRLYHQSRLGPGFVLLCVLGFTTLAVAGIALGWSCLWLRPAPWLLLQWAGCVVTWDYEVGRLQRRTRSFCLDVVAEQRRQQWPAHFVASHDPWIEVAKLFGELLSPNRCVLLRTLEGQMYVRETQWIGCSKGEIDERRRDFRRHPYKKAVDEGQPVLIAEEWLFFKKVDDQLQYLAPLKFRGKLLGFAAVAVSASVVEQDAGYVLGLQRVADQAAEMLQRRRDLGVGAQLLSRDTDQANLKSWGDLIDAAALSARALRGKLTRLEAVIAASPQAGLLFDLYGNLLLADASMQELLAEEGIVVAGDSALSIVAELCSVPVSRIRQTVRELAVRREPHIRTISLPRSGDPCFLHLTPVATNTVGRGIDDVYPFQVMCVRLDLLPAVGLGTLDWLAGAEDVPRSPTTREVS